MCYGIETGRTACAPAQRLRGTRTWRWFTATAYGTASTIARVIIHLGTHVAPYAST